MSILGFLLLHLGAGALGGSYVLALIFVYASPPGSLHFIAGVSIIFPSRFLHDSIGNRCYIPGTYCGCLALGRRLDSRNPPSYHTDYPNHIQASFLKKE